MNRSPAGLAPRRAVVDGWPIHSVAPAHDAGVGRPPVLAHGAGLSFRDLMPYAARLAPPCRVFAPDLPGFGGLPGVPHTANSQAPLELARVTRPFYDRDRI